MHSPRAFPVAVTVDGNTIVCQPDPVVVTCGNGKLIFSLPTGGDWIFPAADAIVVSSPGGQFPRPCHRVSDWVVTLHDDNSLRGSFEYTVTVKNAVTGQVLSRDPQIGNDPPTVAAAVPAAVAAA